MYLILLNPSHTSWTHRRVRVIVDKIPSSDSTMTQPLPIFVLYSTEMVFPTLSYVFRDARVAPLLTLFEVLFYPLSDLTVNSRIKRRVTNGCDSPLQKLCCSSHLYLLFV